jgi:hypothetical protein
LRPVKTREGEAQTDYFGETTAGLALRITRSGAPRLAAGCFSDVVAGEHMTFAGDWVRASDATLWDGVTEYMEEEKLEFDELCREIIRRIRHAGGAMKERDIKRQLPRQCSFQERARHALQHLGETEQVEHRREQTGGRPSISYSLPAQTK